MSFFEKRPWLAVALLSLIAFALRTIPEFDSVFQGSFVNFQETDAWFHVRVVDNLVHHFPHRITSDPYATIGPIQGVATGPFYDWLLASVAWLAGLGHPSEHMVHLIAAWYPAVLGMLIVPIVFLLGRQMFSVRAGLLAAAVIATLPGHFLNVSSLGFTDHHVMESLLSALFLLLLLQGRPILAGLALAAYLLTFVGGAFFVAIVVAWAIYDRIRCLWPRPEPEFPAASFCTAFLLAAVLVAPSYKTFWMPYSIATLLLGAILVLSLDRWRTFCAKLQSPRTIFFTGLALTLVAGAIAALTLAPGLRQALRSVLPFFMPAYFGTTGAVSELQTLVFARGAFTLVPAWKQFAGAYVLSIVAIFLLAELAINRAKNGPTLLFFWGSSTFLLAMGQVRMTYYFAVAAALLSGYLITRIFEGDARPPVRWTVAAILVLALFVPNVTAAIESADTHQGVPEDWRQALDWLNKSTPEPFGDPAFYYANYHADAPQATYSVMAWWDYGYWLEAIARRVPVTNPTQSHASVAANFFLAQSEDEALRILKDWRSRYVVVNADLPLLMNDKGTAIGNFPDFFVWDKTKNLDDYFLVALEPAPEQGEGKVRARVLYLPAYYRSMAVRLFIHGVEGVADPNGASIAYFDRKPAPRGATYRALTQLRAFDSLDQARSAEPECRAQGCVIVGENPQVSCVPLEPLSHFRPAFASDTPILGSGKTQRSAVQVYEIIP